MSAALLHTGRPILFSCDSDELILHENNQEYPAQWAPDICNIARINWDIWVTRACNAYCCCVEPPPHSAHSAAPSVVPLLRTRGRARWRY